MGDRFESTDVLGEEYKTDRLLGHLRLQVPAVQILIVLNQDLTLEMDPTRRQIHIGWRRLLAYQQPTDLAAEVKQLPLRRRRAQDNRPVISHKYDLRELGDHLPLPGLKAKAIPTIREVGAGAECKPEEVREL